MNPIKVSMRLSLLARWIPVGSKLADIGSDHAYLPVYAFQTGRIVKAIAGEVNQGPYESARETVQGLNLSTYIEVRKGNGLEVIEKHEVDTIVVAGMGGALIRNILEEGKSRLSDDQTLILQPNNGEEALRDWLYMNQWKIDKEAILEEDGHIYEAMKVSKSKDRFDYSQEDLLFGPFLRVEQSATFIKKWSRELEKWEGIYRGIQENVDDSMDRKERLAEIKKHIKRIEEALQ
ncbi:tRNA (adenine(22)-N(1))-methyltransferase TrmK [Pullulanibacillus sp. KACC 23026]|uniref:tRNA (adenine(22)-N(1))-methyltransferase n=1 Tax=Pullulanibacillus sp. KACC 23026 TaxID=3028315 RepID=UPI0023AFF159|nr:tRNA (adenine(22)-N(1))-methyltransferase TrmK [Pullulanibacillus sp. KACC 23026]WEG14249.1 tRNA (adenine(22)-N(1))-methyltransferase TrmK [Pullulanibacillus sp. KACC 23026]